MREDIFAAACQLLRECVDGTVDDCTAWNRRTRAFLATFAEPHRLEFDKCPSGRKCVQTTTGCLKGQCLERLSPAAGVVMKSDLLREAANCLDDLGAEGSAARQIASELRQLASRHAPINRGDQAGASAGSSPGDPRPQSSTVALKMPERLNDGPPRGEAMTPKQRVLSISPNARQLSKPYKRRKAIGVRSRDGSRTILGTGRTWDDAWADASRKL